MPKLTTTMRPGQELTVSPQEATDLLRRGLVKTLDGKPVGKDIEKAVEKVADGGQKENPK